MFRKDGRIGCSYRAKHEAVMKIEIEISEETAACIWSDGWGEKTGQSVALCVKNLVESHADQYRKSFPDDVKPGRLPTRYTGHVPNAESTRAENKP
jgi:hypothetical protein